MIKKITEQEIKEIKYYTNIDKIENYYDKISMVNKEILKQYFQDNKVEISDIKTNFLSRTELFKLYHLYSSNKTIEIINIYSENEDSILINKRIFDSSLRSDFYVPIYTNLDEKRSVIKGFFHLTDIEEYSISSNDSYKIYFSDIISTSELFYAIENYPDYTKTKNKFENSKNIKIESDYLKNLINILQINNKLDVNTYIHSFYDTQFYGILASEENSKLFLEMKNLLEPKKENDNNTKIIDMFEYIKNQAKNQAAAAGEEENPIELENFIIYNNTSFTKLTNKIIKNPILEGNILQFKLNLGEFIGKKILINISPSAKTVNTDDIYNEDTFTWNILNAYNLVKEIEKNVEYNVNILAKTEVNKHNMFFPFTVENEYYNLSKFYVNIFILE